MGFDVIAFDTDASDAEINMLPVIKDTETIWDLNRTGDVIIFLLDTPSWRKHIFGYVNFQRHHCRSVTVVPSFKDYHYIILICLLSLAMKLCYWDTK